MESKLRRLAKCAPREIRGNAEQRVRGRFVRARTTASLTQIQCAAWLGVSTSSVEDWERGASRIPAWALDEVEALVVDRRSTGT
jgi:DNA-binding transcriptional regulator YiaG